MHHLHPDLVASWNQEPRLNPKLLASNTGLFLVYPLADKCYQTDSYLAFASPWRVV